MCAPGQIYLAVVRQRQLIDKAVLGRVPYGAITGGELHILHRNLVFRRIACFDDIAVQVRFCIRQIDIDSGVNARTRSWGIIVKRNIAIELDRSRSFGIDGYRGMAARADGRRCIDRKVVVNRYR